MRCRHALATAVLAFALLGAGCTDGGATIVRAPPTAPPKDASPSPVPTGAGSAAAAREALCDVPDQKPPPAPATEGTPPQIAAVEHEVETVRGLTYEVPVPIEPVTQAQISSKILKSFDDSFPADLYDRRSRAWQTIGVIPPGTSIRDELKRFQSGEVAGFYVPETGELVYIGSDQQLSPLSHIILAHELTHALDDQHFHLERIDPLLEHCRDEEQQAALGAIEGSAQFYSFRVASQFLTPQETLDAAQESSDLQQPSDVAPFIERMELWPYEAGLSFITRLQSQGGNQAVNDAIRQLPTSTEQVIHPERYPNDVPQPLDVADLGPALGPGWTDLDVSDVGEQWLANAFALRLDNSTAVSAAAGWDGGIYRAWSNGDKVAVVMRTVWDTPGDATEFAAAMRDWIETGSAQQASVVPTDATHVDVLFGSDAATLASLETADR